MTLGAGEQWLPQFRSLTDRVLPYIVALFPDCAKSLRPSQYEDAITRNLVKRLTSDPEFRRIAWAEYHFEPFKSDSRGNWISTGEIDMVVYPVGFWSREFYLACECKRLNVTSNQGKRSLAREYVLDGVFKFVSEQYSRNLPLACMLGYVVDGRVLAAKTKVQAAMRSRTTEIGSVSDPFDLPALGSSSQFVTSHIRTESGMKIQIRHLLVSCV